MNLLYEFLIFKLQAKNKHQIHSPFVYDFITKCMTLKIDLTPKRKLNLLKYNLKKSNETIYVHDFGIGSKKLKNKRSIKQIYKTASSKGVYADLMYQLVKHYSLENILELGTSLGVGTAHFALAHPNVKVTTIDACPNTIQTAKKNLEAINVFNVNFINSTFQDFFDKKEINQFDLIFIDGHHDGNAMLHYLNELALYSHDETIFIIDDIRWSDGMLAAWKQIIKSSEYHLSLDLFRMGMVMKRKHQAKEHFIIKVKNVLKGMI
jgi:predicted O-methyltransferase YrrM